MAYNATEQQQIIEYVKNLTNAGGTAADIVNAANQYGVPIEEVSKLFGMGTVDAQNMIASQPFTAAQVQEARDFINNDFLGGTGEYAFNGDFTGQDQFQNRYLAAAQDALGWSDAAVAQILGPNVNADQVGTYQKQFDALDPRITAMYGNMFRQDAGMLPQTPSQTPPVGTTTQTQGAPQQYQDFNMSAPPMWNAGGYGSYNQQNPYLSDMSAVLQGRINRNLTENQLPAIRSEYRMLGGQGGSRQGIAEGMALRGANEGFADALTGMYYGDYNNSQNRNLSRYGMDQNAYLTNRGQDMNFLLGSRGQDMNFFLGNQGQKLGFWGSERDNDRQDLLAAGSLYGLGQQGPWGSLTSAGNIYGNAAGNNTNVTIPGQDGGWSGALGGGLLGLGMWNKLFA